MAVNVVRGVAVGLVWLAIVPLLLTGCAGGKDLRYRQSVDSPPLVIPEGLDAPRYARDMEIPPAGRELLPPQDQDLDIEKPPSLSGNS